jgi:hypothetical protein
MDSLVLRHPIICTEFNVRSFHSVVFEKKIYPVLKSPTHIGFIGVKKMGRKSHTWAPLNRVGWRFYVIFSLNLILVIP